MLMAVIIALGNGNELKFGATFRYGIVFAPMKCSYQKEAKGMQIPKMYFLFRCKKPTSQYGPANSPVSGSAL